MADRILLGTRKGVFDVRKTGGTWKAGEPKLKGEPIAYAVRGPAHEERVGLDRPRALGLQAVRARRTTAPRSPRPSRRSTPRTRARARSTTGCSSRATRRSRRPSSWARSRAGSSARTTTAPRGASCARSGTCASSTSGPAAAATTPASTRSSSIPRNAKHLQVGVSCAGVLETKDDGASWAYVNKGMPSLAGDASPVGVRLRPARPLARAPRRPT